MIGKTNMNDSKKKSRVSQSPVAELPQAKIFVPEDLPKVGGKSKPSLSNAVRTKNQLAWYVALNSKPRKERISCVPQIKWKCPPKFTLNTAWHVATGEGSQEAKALEGRETNVQEVVHPFLSAMSPSPLSSPDMRGEYCDDSQIPVIPIIPVEESTAGAEMQSETSPPGKAINLQPQTLPKCPLASGNLPLSESNSSGPQDQPVNDKALPGLLCGIESGDLEVAVAAAATVAAIMESKEQIDTALLIKFLTDPEMVKKLIDENGLRAKPGHETTPTPESCTSFPSPSSKPASVDKLADECSEPLSRSVPSSSRPQTVNQSLAQSPTKVGTAADKSACELGGIYTGSEPMCTSKPAKRSSAIPRSNSEVLSLKNLAIECGGLAHSPIHQAAGVKQLRPLISSTLRPDEETIKRLIKQYGAHDNTGAKPQAPLSPSTSNSNVEAIRNMINKYGVPNAAGVTRVASPIASALNMEGVKKTIHEVRAPDRGWGSHPSLVASTLKTAMMTAPMENLHVLPNALESNFNKTVISHPSLVASTLKTAMMTAPMENLHVLPNALESNKTGISHITIFSPTTASAPPVELNCYKSLIKEHGTRHAYQEDELLKLSQPDNYLQGPELPQNKLIEMNPKYQKPCMFFNSSKGCRNGSNCPYQHDVSKQRRDGGVVEVAVRKRRKFSEADRDIVMRWHS